MKVEGPGKASGPKGVSKTGARKGTDGSSFGSLIDETSETMGGGAVSGTMNIGQIDALLSLQEADSSTSEEAGKRAKRRAESLLDQLDQVKIGLLAGGIPKTLLNSLANTINVHRENIADPKLAAILDEIDLRVQVELAKHSRY